MFRGLRVRLTVLYVAVGLLLIGLLGLGTYSLVNYYFQQTTDLALEHVMALHFSTLGAPMPRELQTADQAWSAGHSALLPQPVSRVVQRLTGDGPTENSGTEGDDFGAEEASENHLLNADLAAVFVVALSSDGHMLPGFNLAPAPIPPDLPAVQSALQHGRDLRTISVPGVGPIRLLTYHVPGVVEPSVLQVGRSLSDQEDALGQLIVALGMLGGLCLTLLATGSWWLAGQSIQPAQSAWERQQAFVANASHELRTPLTLMRASTEAAIRDLPADGRERELLQTVLRESDHMSRLIEDQLLLSRLDASELPLSNEAVSVADLFQSTAESMAHLAEDHGVRLTIEGGEGAVWADPTRLRQVFLILVDNALRHTRAGNSITLSAAHQGGHQTLTVADTGTGIPASALPYVFDRFFRADESHAGPGTGLGLSIAKALVEAQGGTIELSSQSGQGTRVRLTLREARL